MQEVTLTGVHVRFIGVDVIKDNIWGIAANAELIVATKWGCFSNNRIMMFDAVTGAFVRAFGDYGDARGQLMKLCCGIRFTPDGCHIVIAEGRGGGTNGRLSVFTLAGEFVRCIGDYVGELILGSDVEFAANGDVIVCDSLRHNVSVYSAGTRTIMCQWGGLGQSDGKFQSPAALATCGGQLYVLDSETKRVQVFE